LSPAGHAEKILIIHSGGIGDLLLALPAMRIFRRAYPASPLELMGRPERLALVSFDLASTSVHSADQGEMAYFYAGESPLPVRLSVFFSSFQAALVFGRGGGRVLAENLRRAGIERVILLPSFPPEGLRVHVSHYLVEGLVKAGIDGEKILAPLLLPEKEIASAGDFWARHGLIQGEKILALHPGSGSPAKNWAPKYFAEVARRASGRSRVLLISGPADDGARELKQSIKKGEPVVADQLPLIRLASVLSFCTAYVGNDSGITHLASALGIPTIALFGPTDPAVWGPRGPQVKVIYGKDFCSPCSPGVRPECGPPYLEGINPDEVWKLLDLLLR
jgi:ADP-heptose:LPS heptosyltransferase